MADLERRGRAAVLAGGLRREPDAAELHNGMAWSPDGRRFCLFQSQDIHVFARGPDGRIGERRAFAAIPEAPGAPDGAAVDAQGGC